ncbi:transposase, partial [Streptomyces yangpuensis]
QLLASAGDNPDRLRSEAAFAHLCGAAPVPASSGRTNRHRLNRGGDRAANNALHTIVLVRMKYDQRTQEYVARRTAEGMTKKDIVRCLKRFVAREVYRHLPHTARNREPLPQTA